MGLNTSSPLPTITEELTIDGYTQPGASANTQAQSNDAVLQIELDGTWGLGSGLVIAADNVTIRGLVINRFFNYNGIDIQAGADNAQVEGNFIGTDATGATALGNWRGVMINSENNIIGGTTPAARNLISGNILSGIKIEGASATANLVQGNFIGIDVFGSSAINSMVGIGIEIVDAPATLSAGHELR